jgi:hypothetical protein
MKRHYFEVPCFHQPFTHSQQLPSPKLTFIFLKLIRMKFGLIAVFLATLVAGQNGSLPQSVTNGLR